MKNIKNYFSVVCGLLLMTLTSCLSDEDTDTFLLSNAEILTFSVYRNTPTALPVLDSVVFYIDQVNGRIYNKDSVRYGTQINQQVFVNYTAGGYGFYNMKRDESGAIVDSVWVNPGDSIDLSKPLLLKSYGGNGVKYKMYTAELNIAKIDPDLIQYRQLSSGLTFLQVADTRTVRFNGRFYTYSRSTSVMELHTSTDGKDWASESLNGFPTDAVLAGMTELNGALYIVSQDHKMYSSVDGQNWSEMTPDYPVTVLLGSIQPGRTQPGVLACIVASGGASFFAVTSGDGQFTLGYPVPADFPVEGFAPVSFNRMQTQYLLLAGGVSGSGAIQNQVWSTENGTYWAMISEANGNGRFSAMTGANVLIYNGYLWLFNGKRADGFNPEIYRSVDSGIHWDQMPLKCKFPVDYSQRSNASMVLGDRNFFYIIGGNNVNPIADCWSGRQNKLIVD